MYNYYNSAVMIIMNNLIRKSLRQKLSGIIVNNPIIGKIIIIKE